MQYIKGRPRAIPIKKNADQYAALFNISGVGKFIIASNCDIMHSEMITKIDGFVMGGGK